MAGEGTKQGRGSRRKQAVHTVCQGVADAMGYELVEAGIEKEGAGHYLRVYIDKPGGVSLDDCEAYHRAVQPLLEEVEYDFLEVSSPGLDRPLKTPRDFQKRAGETVTVKLFQALDGRKTFQGQLVGLEDGQIVLDLPDGQRARFPQRGVAVARPVLLLDELNALE
jgi:ribosome maturation factor RimP